MYTSRILPTLLVGALLLAGCGDDGTDPMAPDAPNAAWVDGQKMVPIEWTFRAWAEAGPSVPCLLPDGTLLGAVAPTYAVSGDLSHVGALDEEASSATIHGCEVVMGPGGPEAVTGPITAHLVGPQGDAVDLAGTLTVILTAGHAVGDWEIVGGGGRFSGATGYLDTLEHPAPDGSGSVGSGSGMISQPKSVTGGRH